MSTAAVRSKSIRQQFADTALDVGREDPNLVVLVGDISSGILRPFAQACPGRFYNVGICEPTIVSMAAGLSKMGFHPVVHTIAPFLIERAFEQWKLDFCYHRLGGNLVSVGGAFDYSNLGCTHHCYGDWALLKTLEGTEIFAPGSAVEYDALFRQCYANDRLSLFRIPACSHGIDFEPEALRAGEAIRVAEGEDLTLVAVGPRLSAAVAARERLKAEGWRPEVLYLHSIRPLDTERIVASAFKTRRLVVIEEHMRSGGVGDDILRATQGISGVRVVSLSIPDRFVRDYGTFDEQLSRLGLDAAAIVASVRENLRRN